MQKKLMELIGFIKENEATINLRMIYEQASQYSQKTYSDQGVNRAYYAGSSSDLWLENGVYLHFGKGRASFGQNHEYNDFVELRSIKSDKFIEFYSRNSIELSHGKKTTINIISDKEIESLNNFLSDNESSITAEDFINYLNRSEASISGYIGIDKTLQADDKVISAVFKQILYDSVNAMNEIKSYDDISPYGGEDINYYPESVSHHFMNALSVSCSNIGLDKILKERPNGLDINDYAFKTLIENGETDYLTEALESYNNRMSFLNTYGEILQLAQKYKDFMPLLEDEGLLLHSAARHQDTLYSITQKLDKVNSDLEALMNKKFNLLDRMLFKRGEYLKTMDEINDAESSQYFLTTDIESLKNEHGELMNLHDKFCSINSNDSSALIEYFSIRGLPHDETKLIQFFDSIQKNLSLLFPEVNQIQSAFERWNVISEVVEVIQDEDVMVQ